MNNDDKPPSKQASWLDRLVQRLSATPENREELAELIIKSHESSIIDSDALNIMEGALRLAELHAGDIMIPRSQVETIKIDAQKEDVVQQIIETGHSRFPVTGETSDDVLGILLAKDLISLLSQHNQAGENGDNDEFDLKNLLRPATIIPESKRLSVLLREFRERRYHMAIVVDEYGSVAGLVTIEDILEEIVGDIEDETDEAEAQQIQAIDASLYMVEAQTEIEDFNEHFDTGLSDEEYDTIGGLVVNQFGHLPEVGEALDMAGFRFEIAAAENRRVLSMHVSKLES